ncbi:hypothetical protein [Prevotella scopos]|uniref:hypothetical protein n=1 Tax=Prevotella scopos TaxID=589437 RepID=UPI000B046C50
MAKKKTTQKSKTFTEALGLNNIINDKTGFVAGSSFYALLSISVSLFLAISAQVQQIKV